MIEPLSAGLGVEHLPDGRVRVMKQFDVGTPWICMEVVDAAELEAAVTRAASTESIHVPMATAAARGGPSGGLSPEVRAALRRVAEGHLITPRKPEKPE